MLAIVLEESIIEVLSYLLKGRVELDKENERVICGLSYLFFLPSWGWEGGAGGGGKGGGWSWVSPLFSAPPLALGGNIVPGASHLTPQ